ncbi:hypothetical protein [Sutcliffiella horikoshii]
MLFKNCGIVFMVILHRRYENLIDDEKGGGGAHGRDEDLIDEEKG